MKRFLAASLLSLAGFGCVESPPENEPSPLVAEESAEDADELSEVASELKTSVPVGDGGAPMCISREEICKQLVAIAPAACEVVLPAFGCGIKRGFFGPNYQREFCEEACEGRSFVSRRLCISACNAFVDSSPGPYSGISQRFFSEGCNKAVAVLKKFCRPTNVGVVK